MSSWSIPTAVEQWQKKVDYDAMGIYNGLQQFTE